jgi:hypothetical protein
MQARRARVRQIRRTVTAVAVTVFIALFATIYIQMAAGKDPALGSSTTSAQVSETSTPSATSTSSSSSDDSSSDNSSSGTMTTAQS